jgi:hypothetical protein
MQDSDDKDISDPSYGAADFQNQLAGGQLRWLATVLAVASVGFFIYLLTRGDQAELHFPFHITGGAAVWTIGIAAAVWALIAITNWMAWLGRKKDAA